MTDVPEKICIDLEQGFTESKYVWRVADGQYFCYTEKGGNRFAERMTRKRPAGVAPATLHFSIPLAAGQKLAVDAIVDGRDKVLTKKQIAAVADAVGGLAKQWLTSALQVRVFFKDVSNYNYAREKGCTIAVVCEV